MTAQRTIGHFPFHPLSRSNNHQQAKATKRKAKKGIALHCIYLVERTRRLCIMPWKTLCGFPPTRHEVTLLIPNGAWRPDTVITDSDGNEYFVMLDVENKMRSYEAIFGDLEGNRLVCVKRHLKKAFWKDGFYFCTYRPNYKGQKALRERDRDNKRVYPHSYVRLDPLKGRFFYAFFDDQRELQRTRLYAENQWMGMMMVCCTPLMRWGRFTGRFKKKDNSTHIFVDQWRNSVRVMPGQDVLASLCLAYIFDKCQSQPMVAVMGRESDDEYESDGGSIDSNEEYDYEKDNYYADHPDDKRNGVQFENMPDLSQREDFEEEYFAETEDFQEDHQRRSTRPGMAEPYYNAAEDDDNDYHNNQLDQGGYSDKGQYAQSPPQQLTNEPGQQPPQHPPELI
uniref:Uncharacterized protein n=2 Tax=Amphora coffeiformis TaxID=265554 RepID=A0A7S3L2A3_9STRA|mmetsp:Transcript_9315/g.17778  ORF Transcript_9315/g.17778 Transcript_9315/m.17778 type:complete len:396 (-) Transcript_9315:258-1445(-)